MDSENVETEKRHERSTPFFQSGFFRLQVVPVRLARIALATYWPCLMLGTHWPRFRIETQDTVFEGVALDKLLHAGAFFGLYALITASRLDTWKTARASIVQQPWRAALLAFGIAVAYAIVDETSQAWFDREVSVGDVAANCAGVAFGFVLFCIVRRCVKNPHATV